MRTQRIGKHNLRNWKCTVKGQDPITGNWDKQIIFVYAETRQDAKKMALARNGFMSQSCTASTSND